MYLSRFVAIVYELYFLNIITQARGKQTGTGQLTSLEVIDLRNDKPKHYPYRGSLPVDLLLRQGY